MKLIIHYLDDSVEEYEVEAEKYKFEEQTIEDESLMIEDGLITFRTKTNKVIIVNTINTKKVIMDK